MRMVITVYHHARALNTITCRVFFKGNGIIKKGRILCYGVNQEGDINGKFPGIHAEHDALRKLMPLRNKKKLESINILVIRVSSKNKIQPSKPCSDCIDKMILMPPKIGYNIKNIYYSDSGGSIVKTNLNTLDTEEKHYTKYFRHKRRLIKN